LNFGLSAGMHGQRFSVGKNTPKTAGWMRAAVNSLHFPPGPAAECKGGVEFRLRSPEQAG